MRCEALAHVVLAAIRAAGRGRRAAWRTRRSRRATLRRPRRPALERLQPLEQRRLALLCFRGRRSNDDAAAERPLSGLVAQDEAIAAQREERLRRARSGSNAGRLGVDRTSSARPSRIDLAHALRGAQVHTDALMVLDAVPAADGRTSSGRRSDRGQRDRLVADDVARARWSARPARQVQRDALPPIARRRPAAPCTSTLRTRSTSPPGRQRTLSPTLDFAAHRGAGDDRGRGPAATNARSTGRRK